MKKLLDEIIPVVRQAGEEIMKIYDEDHGIQEKKDRSPVTKADLLANEMICNHLEKYGYPILSEESKDDHSRLTAKKVWVVDPLDGTMDFIQKTDEFSIMVGLLEDNVPVLGIVYQPAQDKLYYGIKDQGSYLVEGDKETKLQVSNITNLSEARAIISRNHLSDETLAILNKVGISQMVKCGSNGIKIGKIAAGEADFFVNPTDRMGEWDSCALEIILKEAGGEITGVNGVPLVYNQEEPRNRLGILATNRKLQLPGLQS
ncbi:3'(2'),5'-bisphosphate nucleotidase CysQ [Candidatus Peregrinibacteria bacterium]|jgi:3'(2'), 5'-bisphosphate nucleotidase|nr:3'(2'),5'-bisphosphate nucleotidase CysQ [Candidatus Peregrinibacteria bacterium]MBT7703665.1 3'(2'),5'-bisphosphate nucleotidase CysQ [Candidatus Peregrinibacteria bacterium]